MNLKTELPENTYKKEFLKGIFQELKIENSEIQEEFKKELLTAGWFYQNNKKNYVNRITPAKEIQILKKLENNIQELEHDLHDALNSGINIGRISKGLEKSLKEIPNKNLEKLFISNGITNLDHFFDILRLLKKSAKYGQEIKGFGPDGGEKGIVLLAWVSQLGNFIKNNSKYQFTAGKYYKEGKGYNSQTIDLLKKLIAPIDSKITKQEIATALRKYTRRKKSS